MSSRNGRHSRSATRVVASIDARFLQWRAIASAREKAARRILLVSGSTRGASTNTAALRAAGDALRAQGAAAELYEGLAELPAFNPDGPVCSATKWALRGLGLALRQELHGTGVGVSTIFPGPIREAGMFARTGVELPRGAGSNSPAEGAAAVVRAIERDRAEITVAAGSVRLSAALSGVAPVLVGHAARRAGAGKRAPRDARRASSRAGGVADTPRVRVAGAS